MTFTIKEEGESFGPFLGNTWALTGVIYGKKTPQLSLIIITVILAQASAPLWLR